MVAPETGNMVCDPILSKRPPPRICRLFSPLASERGSFDGKSKDIMGYPHLCGVHWRVFRWPLSRGEMVCDPTSSGRFSLPLGSSHRVPLGITRHPRPDMKSLRGASRIEGLSLASSPRITRSTCFYLLAVIRDLHFSVSKFVSNFETVSNVKILVVNSLNIWDTVL